MEREKERKEGGIYYSINRPYFGRFLRELLMDGHMANKWEKNDSKCRYQQPCIEVHIHWSGYPSIAASATYPKTEKVS